MIANQVTLWHRIALALPYYEHISFELVIGKIVEFYLNTRAETDAPPKVAQLARDFNEMSAAVEKMVTEQKAFTGNEVHELRTPLTAIRLRTEILLEDEPDEALTRRYIEEIDAEARRLSRLVEEFAIVSAVRCKQD